MFVTQGSDLAHNWPGDPAPSLVHGIEHRFELRGLFHLGTDMRYTYVSVGVKMHAYRTVSKRR